MICDRYQLADIFAVSADTVKDWTKSGCPVYQQPKTGKGIAAEERKRYFDSAAVHAWLLARALRNSRWG